MNSATGILERYWWTEYKYGPMGRLTLGGHLEESENGD